MSVKKKIDVVYVPPIPDHNVPAHIVLEWRLKDGRKCKKILELEGWEIMELAAVEDAE